MEANKNINNIEHIEFEKDEEFVITDTLETGKNNIEVSEELMAVDLTNKNDKTSNNNISSQKIKPEQRKVMVPANRMKPLKDNWATIVRALVVRNIFSLFILFIFITLFNQ